MITTTTMISMSVSRVGARSPPTCPPATPPSGGRQVNRQARLRVYMLILWRFSYPDEDSINTIRSASYRLRKPAGPFETGGKRCQPRRIIRRHNPQESIP